MSTQAVPQQVPQLQNSSTQLLEKAHVPTHTAEKDATLIELLKRGTKVAVKRTCSDPGQITTTQSTTISTRAIVSTCALEVDSSPSLAFPSRGSTSPLSLTISQPPSSAGSSDLFTLTYSANSSPSFLSDSDVYSVNDTAMLLQAVDSIQLLQDSTMSDQLDDIGPLSEYTSISENVALNHKFTPSRQLQAVLDSPLPDSLVEFGTLTSKDYMLYGCSSNESPNTPTSPLPSPLAYPTPPASHEAVAQVSPFLDDSHHFSDAGTFFHEDKKANSFLLDENNEFFTAKSVKDNNNLTENEQILQLKNELFNDSKSILDEHDLFKGDNSFMNNESKTFIGDKSAKLQHFNQNLDFLDETQAFNIDDDPNSSSPLSSAFFSANLSSAEEVKEALDEILPNEDDGAGSSLDLYFLSGLSLQSQMMSNSDDPLLSSIPRDFTNSRQPNQGNQHETPKYDTELLSPPETKKIKAELRTVNLIDNKDKNRLSVQTTEQVLMKDNLGSAFLSPNSISSSGSSPKLHCALLTQDVSSKIGQKYSSPAIKKHEQFKSNMKRSSQLHYTPSPMLNPERLGNGLFTKIPPEKLIDVDEEESVIDLFESTLR